MIYTTVGLHFEPFTRLVKEMDQIAGNLDDEVIIQKGTTEFVPIHAKYFDYVPIEVANDHFQKAKIIVSHAGIGSIITARYFHKPLIIVPRLKKFGEHFDDHQLEIANAMKNEEFIQIVHDVVDLEETVKSVINSKKNCVYPPNKKEQLLTAIQEYVNTL